MVVKVFPGLQVHSGYGFANSVSNATWLNLRRWKHYCADSGATVGAAEDGALQFPDCIVVFVLRSVAVIVRQSAYFSGHPEFPGEDPRKKVTTAEKEHSE